MKKIYVIAHNIRSTHNIGSLIRTCEGLGIDKLFMTGYTPYPLTIADTRLPHIAQKLDQQIAKTALNAQASISWEHRDDIDNLLSELRQDNFTILGLEQSESSASIIGYHNESDVVLVLGSEVTGIAPSLIQKLDGCLEIPMLGSKESFNVVQATAIALYQLRFY